MGKKCKVKLDVGTVYQKEEGGTYYFRYQVQHERKCVSLKTWRLEKFNNREFLRWEKVAELFYASERENSKQNSSLIRFFLLNSNTQDFWFCETQFCAEKDLNRNLVTQEGAKILFTSKSTCKSPSSI